MLEVDYGTIVYNDLLLFLSNYHGEAIVTNFIHTPLNRLVISGSSSVASCRNNLKDSCSAKSILVKLTDKFVELK